MLLLDLLLVLGGCLVLRRRRFTIVGLGSGGFGSGSEFF